MSAPASVVITVVLWYGISFAGVVMNKSVLSHMSIEPGMLALFQTASTTILGFFLARRSGSLSPGKHGLVNLSVFLRLGVLRFLSVVLGLISLKHVAASFTETVKASSPIFTVTATFILTGERTSLRALLTLIPVMGGLMLSSVTELSFTPVGFLAASAANVGDCVQNVFCKTLLQESGQGDEAPQKSISYSPSQLQYYSSMAALVVQSPYVCWQVTQGQIVLPRQNYERGMLIIAGVVYFIQSTMVLTLMSHFSPVTIAVLNTVKRAMIIAMSAAYFGNVITPLSGLGTIITIAGGYSYGLVKNRSATPSDLEAQGEGNSAREMEPTQVLSPLSESACGSHEHASTRQFIGNRSSLVDAS